MHIVVAFLLIAAFFCRSADAAGGSSKPSKPASTGPSLQEQAVEHYNKGLQHRDKAWKYEKKAAEAKKEKDRGKNLKKAAKEYEKAIKEQLQATQKNPHFHQAFSSLGYAYRKSGEYDKALQAYDKALNLNPNYTEAIEYRAETYLGLNRVAEAQDAYEQLFVRDPKRAGKLLTALREWAGHQRENPVVEVTAERLQKVEDWISIKVKAAEEMGGTGEEGTKEW